MFATAVPGPKSKLTIAEYRGQLTKRAVPEPTSAKLHVVPPKQGAVLLYNWNALVAVVKRNRAKNELRFASKYIPSQFVAAPAPPIGSA